VTIFCEYGCNQKAKFQLKNKRYCCCKTPNSCPGFRKKNSLSHKGNKHSIETRNKISCSNKGKIVTKETREKIKKSLEEKKESGWINHPETAKEKMSIKAKQRKVTKETIQKRKETRKGYKHSPETITKISLSNIGKKRSFETRKKISIFMKGKKLEDRVGIEKANQIKEKQSEMLKNGFASYMCSKIRSPSIPQKKLFMIVKELFSSAVIQYKINNYCVDIAIPEKNIVIEYDCWYWHQDKDKDLLRQKDIERLGWKFIRFEDYIPTKEQLQKHIQNLLNIEE
jgi:hypothetical protein